MIDKDLKEYLDVLRANNAIAVRSNDIVKQTVSQLMLMLANSGNAPKESKLASAIMELHSGFIETIRANDAMSNSMVAVMNGKGDFARVLANRIAELKYLEKVTPSKYLYIDTDMQRVEPTRVALEAALAKFNFAPELIAPQKNPIFRTLGRFKEHTENMVPRNFSVDPGEEPIENFLTAEKMPFLLMDPAYKSGVYAAFSKGADEPFGWITLLRVHSTNHPGLQATVVQHYSADPVIFFYHPYEDYWQQWDQATYFAGITADIEEELQRTLEAADPFLPTYLDETNNFHAMLDPLQQQAVDLFEMAQMLPERASIMPYSEVYGGPRPLAEFSRNLNVARVGVVCKNAVLVFYGTQLTNDKWIVNVNVIRPAQPGTEIIEPVNPTSLSSEHRAALIQAAHYAMQHWTKIAREKQATLSSPEKDSV